jgi:hypothetical protein
VPPAPEQREIDRLHKCRAKPNSLHRVLGMSLKGMGGIAADLKTLGQRFDQVIARIDQRVKELVEETPIAKNTLRLARHHWSRSCGECCTG